MKRAGEGRLRKGSEAGRKERKQASKEGDIVNSVFIHLQERGCVCNLRWFRKISLVFGRERGWPCPCGQLPRFREMKPGRSVSAART